MGCGVVEDLPACDASASIHVDSPCVALNYPTPSRRGTPPLDYCRVALHCCGYGS